MAREDDVWRVIPSRLTVQPGGSLCVMVAPLEGQVSVQVKPLVGSSGTLEVLGVSFCLGFSGYMPLSAQDGASLSGTGFVIDASAASEPFKLKGPAYFTLNAIGATIVATISREIGANK